MTVAKAERPASTPWPEVVAAFDAVIFLHYGMMWVATAGCLAMVIGRRAFGMVEGSPVLSAASSAILYSLTVGVLLYPVAIMLIGARGMRSVSKDAKKDIKKPLTPRQIVWKMLTDPVMFGALILMAFIMLIPSDDFLVSHKGSQRAQVGSIWKDVGILGAGSTNCFIILPATVLRQWRIKLTGYSVVLLSDIVVALAIFLLITAYKFIISDIC